MALPLPNYLSEEQGGGIVNSMAAGNALANANHLRKYNQIKAKYAPETLLAQAASQAAYANNVGPQYIAKILQDAGFKGNTSDPVLKALVERVQNAGMMGNPMINTLNQRILERYGNAGQQHQNPLSWMMDKLQNILHPGQQGNALANFGGQMPVPQQGGNTFNQPTPAPQSQPVSQSQPVAQTEPQTNDEVQPEPSEGLKVPVNENDPELFKVAEAWKASPEGQAAIAKSGNPNMYPGFEVLQDFAKRNQGKTPVELTVDTGNREENQRSYQQNEAAYEEGTAQGKETGKLNAQDVHEIGVQNRALNAASTNLDAIIADANDPEFQDMRNKIPGFQKLQLSALTTLGNKKQQEKIAKFKADIKQYAQNTINSFRGAATGREFNFANDLKPTEGDTIPAIQGKARSLKELNKIAYEKNFLVSTYMDKRNKHPMSLTDAVEKANKAVDISKIKKDVERLVHPQKVANQDDIKHMAKIHNKSTEEIKAILKSKGVKYEG